MAKSVFSFLPDGSQSQLFSGGGGVTIRPPQPSNPGLISPFFQYAGQMGQAQASPFQAFAPSAANMYGSYADMMKGGAQTMGQMFGSYANAFGQYGNTIGNIAGNAGIAAANDNAGRYGAWAGGLSGYNNMLGALGAGALGAYGSAANAALQSQAMRESAYAKAFSDSIAANQAALSQYGTGREASLAAMANAYGNTAGQLGQARGNMATAAANLGGAGSTALANLGSGVANAAANAASGTAQGQAALSAAIANSLSGLSVGEQNALAGNAASANTALAGLANAAANARGPLGQAGAALGVGLGNNAANVAGNSMNYTRDMAKLDLARLLGIGQLNVSSQLGSSLGGAFGDAGGGISLSGPSGLLGTGSYGGAAAGGPSGVSSGQPPIYMEPSQGWYSSPQYYDAGGMSAISGLRDRGYGQLDTLLSDTRNTTDAGMGSVNANMSGTLANILSSSAAGRGAIQNEAASGGRAISSAADAAMRQIGTEGSAGRGSILDALSAGNAQIAAQRTGLESDAGRAFSGMDAARQDVSRSPVLDAITQGYTGGMGTLRGVYDAGRQDPLALLREVFGNTQTLTNPFLSAGKDALSNWQTGFPPPLQSQPGGFLDPMPYLSALQAGWAPYMSGLDRAMTMQNANVLGILTSGQNTYNNSLGNLTNQYQGAMDAVGSGQSPIDMINNIRNPQPVARPDLSNVPESRRLAAAGSSMFQPGVTPSWRPR